MYYIPETTSPKICLPIFLLLVIFHVAHSHELSSHPGREKTHATITENYCFPNIHTWIAILTQGCSNSQTNKSRPNLLTAPQQPFLELHHTSITFFNGHKRPNFTHYVVLHPSPKNDARKHSLCYLTTGLSNLEYQIF